MKPIREIKQAWRLVALILALALVLTSFAPLMLARAAIEIAPPEPAPMRAQPSEALPGYGYSLEIPIIAVDPQPIIEVATQYILPDGNGDYENIASASPDVDHYLNVDDPIGEENVAGNFDNFRVREYLKTDAPVGMGAEYSFTPDISSTPSIYEFGFVDEGSSYTTGISYFTLTNCGDAIVDVYISAGNMTGGIQWTLSDTCEPASMVYGLKTGVSS